MIDSNYNHVIYGHGPNFVMMYEKGKVYREFELHGDRSDCRVSFMDGTVARFSYGKPHLPDTWLCTIEVKGKSTYRITRCDDPDAAIKSDVLEVDSVIFCTRKVEKLSKKKKEEICNYGEDSSCGG